MSVGADVTDGQGKREKGNWGSTGESGGGKKGGIRDRES